MTEKTELRTRLLRLLMVLLTVVAALSSLVHIAIQSRIDEVPASDVPLQMYSLLSAQTWLQAAMMGGLLVMIGYFVLLPVAKRVERHQEEIAVKDAALDFAHRHDKLTGLLDRATFEELLDHSCAVSERHGHVVGLLRLQLSGISGPKNKPGFAAADAQLIDIAGTVKQSIRAADVAARLSDDELAILVPQIRRVEGLGRLADRLIEEVGESVSPDATEMNISCHIGIACSWPSETECASDLLHRSAEALVEAQGEQGSGWRYHSSVIQGMSDRVSVAG